jgi:hypothetical protein
VHISEQIKRASSDANEQHPAWPFDDPATDVGSPQFSLAGGCPSRTAKLARARATLGVFIRSLERVHALPGDLRAPALTPILAGAKCCTVVAVEVRDDHQVVPADSARYVWSSNGRLANGSVPDLDGNNDGEAPSLRTHPGRALYGQRYKGAIKSVCNIQAKQGRTHGYKSGFVK